MLIDVREYNVLAVKVLDGTATYEENMRFREVDLQVSLMTRGAIEVAFEESVRPRA